MCDRRPPAAARPICLFCSSWFLYVIDLNWSDLTSSGVLPGAVRCGAVRLVTDSPVVNSPVVNSPVVDAVRCGAEGDRGGLEPVLQGWAAGGRAGLNLGGGSAQPRQVRISI